MPPLVKLGESPAEFQFEIAFDSGGERGEGVLTLNFFEVNAALVDTGELHEDGQKLTKTYRDRLVKAVRDTARPRDLVSKLTDSQLYAKANEMFLLFMKLGEGTGPSRTSRRPTDSPTSSPATQTPMRSPA